jgi:hypothetical protein
MIFLVIVHLTSYAISLHAFQIYIYIYIQEKHVLFVKACLDIFFLFKMRRTIAISCMITVAAYSFGRKVGHQGLSMAMSQDELKKMVGYKSVDDYVRSGMVVGLGTGSTAYFAVERVGQKLKSGELKDIICIPTSERTKEQALSLGIPLCTLNEKSKLDVAIDGADEVDPNLALVKGGGGALLREKMVEIMSEKFICIVDESKLTKGLGPG